MRLIILTTFAFSVLLVASAQTAKTLTIEDCYKLARQNYPLIKQKEIISKSKEYSIENASRGYLPQFSINGQGTYQSDVTEIPIKIPNTVIPTIGKDQYKIYAEVNQTISDGGVIKMQKQSIEANAATDDQNLEVQLYKLKERINQLFFGILLVKEQYLLTEIQKKDIQNGITKTNASIANGTALKSSSDVLEAELLQVDQHSIEVRATQQAYLDMLGQFVNQSLDETTSLEKPAQISISQNISRPELSLFDTEKKAIDVQDRLINAKIQPKISLFADAGYGRPALNLLKNEFAGYYIGGVRFNWSLSGFYTYKKEKALLENSRKSIEIQKETFLFNTNSTLKQQNAEILKLQELIKSDDRIIQMRSKVKNTATAQLDFGVINSSDYLREVNAEAGAMQSRLLHEIQLLEAQYDQKTTSGN
ncbi:MAG: TolC family protein [Ginsengibacter sp.]